MGSEKKYSGFDIYCIATIVIAAVYIAVVVLVYVYKHNEWYLKN